MNTRIFVSYAREDQAPASSLVKFLRAAGFDTWFDKDCLHPGQDWKSVIEQQIALARLLIICLSSRSVDKTGFVQKEMRLALEQAELRPPSQVYIIPVVLDGCEVPPSLGRWHALDLRPNEAPNQLLQGIQNATGEGARAPQGEHDELSAVISAYNTPSAAVKASNTGLDLISQEFLALIEQESDPEKRGIVQILKEIEPGVTHFFPRIQYGGSPMGLKTRLFRQAVEELVSAGILFPPEHNRSTNTQTYEYQIQ